jgi:hypothetical protein
MWYVGAYEKTGIMARPWADAGFRCLCVDKDCEPGERDGIVFENADMLTWVPPRHVVEEGVAFFAAFPPCNDVAVSGARWFKGKGLGALAYSIQLFERAAFWAEWFGARYIIENPVSTISTYWREPDHSFHPSDYTAFCLGDNYSKKTCVWSGNGFVMPAPAMAAGLPEPDDRIHKAAPSPGRADFRSQTPPGFAEAVFRANAPEMVTDDTDACRYCGRGLMAEDIAAVCRECAKREHAARQPQGEQDR